MPEQQATDDVQLLLKAQAGNAEAFGFLYERYSLGIFRFLFAHLDDRLDAEDLTEEVFIRAWRSLPNYKEQGVPFSAFLYRVAHNALIDHYRTRNHMNRDVEIDEGILRDIGPDPGDLAIAGIEAKELRRVMQQLREEYRTVLVARFLNDLSPEETAQIMGKTVGAVRVLQHRALAAMRKLLELARGRENG